MWTVKPRSSGYPPKLTVRADGRAGSCNVARLGISGFAGIRSALDHAISKFGPDRRIGRPAACSSPFTVSTVRGRDRGAVLPLHTKAIKLMLT
jgi:hypothetical protein